MRLTTKSQYGLRVLGDLIQNWRENGNGYLQVGELAVRCETSQKYLEQVLLPLSHAGILESKRGQHGGYRLNRAPARRVPGRSPAPFRGPAHADPKMGRRHGE